MPTNPSSGVSQETFISDALPAGSAHLGEVGIDRDLGSAVTLLASAARGTSTTGSDVGEGRNGISVRGKWLFFDCFLL